MKSLRPLVNRADQPALFQNYQEFLKYLHRHWGDPDEKGNAKDAKTPANRLSE